MLQISCYSAVKIQHDVTLLYHQICAETAQLHLVCVVNVHLKCMLCLLQTRGSGLGMHS